MHGVRARKLAQLALIGARALLENKPFILQSPKLTINEHYVFSRID